MLYISCLPCGDRKECNVRTEAKISATDNSTNFGRKRRNTIDILNRQNDKWYRVHIDLIKSFNNKEGKQNKLQLYNFLIKKKYLFSKKILDFH